MEKKINEQKYLLIQNELPYVVAQIVPHDLDVVLGHNEVPVLHGVVGLKNVTKEIKDATECDVLFVTTEPDCFMQLSNAFKLAADNLHDLKKAAKGKETKTNVRPIKHR